MLSEQITAWSAGIEYEVKFWKDWLTTSGGRWPGDFQSRMELTTVVVPYLFDIIKDIPRDDIHILDVGAGPVTSIGYAYPGKDLFVTAIDPLAEIYQKLYEEISILPPLRTEFGMAEDLTSYFANKGFDVVHCRNALDHSFDPLRGIKQMIQVAADDGAIILSHHNDEAEREKYNGFHHFNFRIENKELIIWDKSRRINVNRELESEALRFEAGASDIGHIVTIFKTGRTRYFTADDQGHRLTEFQATLFRILAGRFL